MSQDPTHEHVTQLLRHLERDGADPRVVDRLMTAVQGELHRLARSALRREAPGHTLQATALVNEAYLRLVDGDHRSWENRDHFLASAATAIRRILVDHARARRSRKRGGGRRRVTLEMCVAVDAADARLLLVDEALARLAAFDAGLARVVELRFFAGLTVEEAASVLGTSPSSVTRSWRLARAWLRRELDGGDIDPAELGDAA